MSFSVRSLAGSEWWAQSTSGGTFKSHYSTIIIFGNDRGVPPPPVSGGFFAWSEIHYRKPKMAAFTPKPQPAWWHCSKKGQVGEAAKSVCQRTSAQSCGNFTANGCPHSPVVALKGSTLRYEKQPRKTKNAFVSVGIFEDASIRHEYETNCQADESSTPWLV